MRQPEVQRMMGGLLTTEKICPASGAAHYRLMRHVVGYGYDYRTTCEACGRTIRIEGAKWVHDTFTIHEFKDPLEILGSEDLL